jgi:hypothetical protein
MDYRSIIDQTQALLGDVSEGSSQFDDIQYAAAVQWAQEQAAQRLGLTYEEDMTVVVGGTGPWGELLREVPIPADAVKITRLEEGHRVTSIYGIITITLDHFIETGIGISQLLTDQGSKMVVGQIQNGVA